MVLRDIDLLKRFDDAEVGFSLATIDDQTAKIIEPGATKPSFRLNALEQLKQNQISTYIFIAPILPQLTNLDAIFTQVKNKVDQVWLDTFNTKGDNWQNLKLILQKYWPIYVPIYEEIFFNKKQAYERDLKRKIQALGKKYHLMVKICF